MDHLKVAHHCLSDATNASEPPVRLADQEAGPPSIAMVVDHSSNFEDDTWEIMVTVARHEIDQTRQDTRLRSV